MKKLSLILFVVYCCLSASAQTAFKYKHEVNLCTIGAGAANKTPMMNLEIGYSQRIDNTRWRWGTTLGIMNPGLTDFEWDLLDENTLVYYNYIYLLGYADYALTSGKHTAWFLRGGVAPSYRKDIWVNHSEHKAAALTQFGIGLDVGRWLRISWMGFATTAGEFGLLMDYSLGWRWGK